MTREGGERTDRLRESDGDRRHGPLAAFPDNDRKLGRLGANYRVASSKGKCGSLNSIGCNMNDRAAKLCDNPIELYRKLREAWSAETASPPEGWSADNPAKNHCSVTALIVQDHFGGDILTTQTVGGTHFYNLINGTRWDLTVSQFAEPIPFDDNPSSRDAAMRDTTPEKYEAVMRRLQSQP